jgi:hypothetical protein
MVAPSGARPGNLTCNANYILTEPKDRLKSTITIALLTAPIYFAAGSIRQWMCQVPRPVSR